MSCESQLPRGSWETIFLKRDGRGRRAWEAGRSFFGLTPGGRALSPFKVSDDAWEAEGDVRGMLPGRGGLKMDGSSSGIAVTVAEDKVAVERVAVSSVCEEVCESDGDIELKPRRLFGVVDAKPGRDFVGENAISGSRRGASSENASSTLGGTPRYNSA